MMSPHIPIPIASVKVEACVDSVESALAAEQGGATRVELCDNLIEGGTTPSAGMIAVCCERLEIPVFVIVRPRGGDFLYSEIEFEVMRRDVARAVEMGAGGVVLGLLGRDGAVDTERTRTLIREARSLPVTFHRAFDVARDADEALDALIGIGIDRVLTSGGAATAEEGIGVIARLVHRAAGRLEILAGGGVREHNVARIVGGTGVREVHVRATSTRSSQMEYRPPVVSVDAGPVAGDDLREVTEEGRIARIVSLVGEKGACPPKV
jgi:copper homeostasis protein